MHTIHTDTCIIRPIIRDTYWYIQIHTYTYDIYRYIHVHAIHTGCIQNTCYAYSYRHIYSCICMYVLVCMIYLYVSDCICMYVLVYVCMHIHIARDLRVEISTRLEAHLALNEADKMHSKMQQNTFDVFWDSNTLLHIHIWPHEPLSHWAIYNITKYMSMFFSLWYIQYIMIQIHTIQAYTHTIHTYTYEYKQIHTHIH